MSIAPTHRSDTAPSRRRPRRATAWSRAPRTGLAIGSALIWGLVEVVALWRSRHIQVD